MDNDELNLFDDLLDDEETDEDEGNPASTEEEESKKKAEAEAEAKKKAEAEAEEAKKKAEEEQKKKNKDAEEARKRREAESKEKKANEEQVQKLGKELHDFKLENPDVDLKELDKDANFRTFIDGKLLGKKPFKELYKDYQTFVKNIGGKTNDEEEAKRQEEELKNKATPGSLKPAGGKTSDIFSEEEIAKIAEKMPFMKQKDIDAIDEKLTRSINHYKKKGK